MHVKTFTAPTTVKAMALVREELGEDAIIVSTQRNTKGPGIHIVAAQGQSAGAAPPASISPASIPKPLPNGALTEAGNGFEAGFDGSFDGGPGRLDIYETVSPGISVPQALDWLASGALHG